MNDNTAIRRLIESLRLLASEFDLQRAAMPSNVALADEVALLFDDQWHSCPLLREHNAINGETFDLLFGINNRLDSMSNRKELWTDISMQTSHEWMEVRESAKKALSCMGASYVPPKVDWITFE